jgi:RNA recognition motif-containing protein
MITIYVGNLNFKATEEEVHNLFEQFGEVGSVKIITDRESGRSRGFGFVEMDESVAGHAIEELNGKEYNGRNLKVHEAKERTERPFRPNQNRGGFDRRPRNNFRQ